MHVSVHTVYKVQGQVPGTVGPSVHHVLVLLCVSFMASFKAVHQYIGHHISRRLGQINQSGYSTL